MSSATASTAQTSGPLAGAADNKRAWLVNPWFDLFLVANILWPLAMLISYDGNPWLKPPLTFLQMYFLSTAHRWITVLLVFCDPDRFWKEPVRFGGIGILLLALGLTLVGISQFFPHTTDSLSLLMMLDYAWNSWHFAAQHAGISRIYSRVAKTQITPKQVDFERMAIRVLVLWAFFRLALMVGVDGMLAASTHYDSFKTAHTWIGCLDPLFLLPMAMLIVREIREYSPRQLGRLAYILSVAVLYGGWLLAMQAGARNLLGGLFIASGIFHATEYLSIVNWSVQKKTTGIWRYRISRTGVGVVVFILVVGFAHLAVNARYAYGLTLATLLVSLLHYAYDGMIWKSRPKPKS